MTSDEIVVLKNLSKEYERVCDMFQISPWKHDAYVQAQFILAKEEEYVLPSIKD
jgi:lysozyme family protein